MSTGTESCTWCGAELSLSELKPVRFARLLNGPGREYMQCSDDEACDRRQDDFKATLDRLLHATIRRELLAMSNEQDAVVLEVALSASALNAAAERANQERRSMNDVINALLRDYAAGW